MKARVITQEDQIERRVRAAVIRTILVHVLMRREVDGYGKKRLDRYFADLDRYASEYLSFAKCNVGDQKLINRLEKSGVVLPESIKKELLTAEIEADRQQIKTGKYPVPKGVPTPWDQK